jgi:hypothetical protein
MSMLIWTPDVGDLLAWIKEWEGLVLQSRVAGYRYFESVEEHRESRRAAAQARR